jgi:hypothetical protein
VSKNNIMKVGGFIGTLAIGAALVGSAVTGTGAWFSDSHNGNVAASTGRLHLNTTDTNLTFDNLVPGEYKTRNIDFNVSGDSSTNADVWLTFDPTDLGYAKFTGASGDALWNDGGLGRYGHFAVSVNGGAPVFRSYNLQNGPAVDSCGIDGNGNGGSDQQATSPTDTPPYCGVPTAIKLASNVAPGQAATINLTFGPTGKWTAQDAPFASVPFKVVATQVGIRPDAANF